MTKGVTVPKLLSNPSPKLLAPFIEGAQRLESEGVRAITGSCGFLAIYQKELAAAVDIPVFCIRPDTGAFGISDDRGACTGRCNNSKLGRADTASFTGVGAESSHLQDSK